MALNVCVGEVRSYPLEVFPVSFSLSNMSLLLAGRPDFLLAPPFCQI
jgi:hypothetical protein